MKPVTGEYDIDIVITTRLRLKLADAAYVSATAIDVETTRGRVQLSGFVNTAEERTQAEAIARCTLGVKGVQNDIVIRL